MIVERKSRKVRRRRRESASERASERVYEGKSTLGAGTLMSQLIKVLSKKSR